MANVLVNQLAAAGRTLRRPQHRFQLMHKPWQIAPMLLAPVLPGETLRNLLLQSRVVTDPIRNSLVGWWLEYYFFYVKHRDMNNRDDLTAMMLDINNPAGTDAAAHVAQYYRANAGVNWMKWALERIVDEYFRDEQDIGTTYEIDGGTGALPVTKATVESWLDSTNNRTGYVSASEVNIALRDGLTAAGANPVAVTGNTRASEIEAALRKFNVLRDQRLVDMNYEDYLRTYGVRTPAIELHRPELIRYIREWSYPTNHVNPADGKPSAAVSWSIAERADKDRFFSEPGFVVGCTVARPKVYLSAQDTAMSAFLNTAFDWLPALLLADPMHSVKHFATGTGPLPNNADANGYMSDMRDLYLYGDQFVNFPMTEDDKAFVALPTTALQRKYPQLSDAEALFVDTGAGAQIDELRWVRQDGVVNLSIATMQRDATPTA